MNKEIKIEDEIIGKTQTALGPFPLCLYASSEIDSAFKIALFESLTDRLILDEENKTTVDDLRFIFDRLDRSFASLNEREDFYGGVVVAIIYAYSNIGTLSGWKISSSSEDGVFPRIENRTLVTARSASNVDTALWLFNEYEKMAKEKIELEEAEREKVIEKVRKKRRTGNFSSYFG